MIHKMVEEANDIVSSKIKDEKIVSIFKNVFQDTLTKTIKTLEDNSLFMLTGDIPAMWLRDSACQLRPYLPFIKNHSDVRSIISKVIEKQFAYILMDPYANAFNLEENGNRWDDDLPLQKPIVWERKFELDSHCFPILLSYQYWKITNDSSIFSESYFDAIKVILEIWETEQKHSTNSNYTFYREEAGYLKNDGKGTPINETGMIWSAFRPSDDPCEYHFNIPGNLFAVYCLELLKEIIETVGIGISFLPKIEQLYKSVSAGIDEFGVITLPSGVQVFAYEVDGLGNHLLIDDSNMPSLLSLPLLSQVSLDDEIYINTRNYILSSNNSYYYEGELVSGIGSPHTPSGYVWPISLAVEGLTTEDKREKLNLLQKIAWNDAGTNQVHESFSVNDASLFTREWFSWANSMFCELVLDYCEVEIL